MYLKLVLLLLGICGTWSASIGSNGQDQKSASSDLATAETSAKFLNLFGTGSGYPNYGYNYRPTTGYYPGNSGYYPNSGYFPGTGSAYYGSNSGYYGSNTGSYYPGNSGNYYPSSGSYYPSTNILGTQGAYGGIGGYGGYGGYGGLVRPTYG
ncbi:uncharacterized protein Dwil_GK17309 [Drosophila willistoni]|uniref:Prisilkin-39 n=1 Tax=Drosophila willistoni TaxID=7260 RepID=B4MM02_DROWI|nr:glycine-rich RNA-binding protein 3, mitochondrial isoform X2 [Drosophila willistoni]EDW73011.2 uncharacterized protein Dwil_GK17309 [Drosophila willistoni]